MKHHGCVLVSNNGGCTQCHRGEWRAPYRSQQDCMEEIGLSGYLRGKGEGKEGTTCSALVSGLRGSVEQGTSSESTRRGQGQEQRGRCSGKTGSLGQGDSRTAKVLDSSKRQQGTRVDGRNGSTNAQ